MKQGFLYLVCILVVALPIGASGAPVGETGAGAPVQVTTDQNDQIAAAIDGDRMVWVDGRHGGADIYLYDVAGGTETRITNGTAVPFWPEVSGDRIVWQDNRSGTAEVWLFEIAAGTETRIGAGTVPAIDDDTVVWFDEQAGISAMNLTTGTTVRVSGPVQGDPLVVSPDVSGETIVWADGSGGNYTVSVSQGGGEPVPLADGSARQGFPAISGNRVVWSETRNGSSSLVVRDLATGEEERISGGSPGMPVYPDISGDRVVWQNATGLDTDDIYRFDLATGKTVQVTSDDAWQFLPRVSGNRIAWTDNRSGNLDVYLLTLGAAAAAGSPYAFGAEQNGRNVTVPVESEVLVSLAESPSTGYSWNATVSPGLTIADDRYEQNANPEGMVGVGGIRTWTLVPEHAGVFTFSAVYRRPRENVTGLEDRFNLTITAVMDLLDVPSG
ncbi:protease inhibitor I42 family protein [Methanoculleus sp.]|uniref:protease inhibitor I42 family protein n=1 Tax=Methanoculleus sp. TaxID=90427 RepID=UPI002FC7972B